MCIYLSVAKEIKSMAFDLQTTLDMLNKKKRLSPGQVALRKDTMRLQKQVHERIEEMNAALAKKN